MKRKLGDLLVAITFCMICALLALLSGVFLTNGGRYFVTSMSISWAQSQTESNIGESNPANDNVAKIKSQQEELIASSDVARFCHYSTKSVTGIAVMVITIFMVAIVFLLTVVLTVAGVQMVFEQAKEYTKKAG